MVDYQDDGTFEECTDCSNLSYAAGIFTFNVSHFTEYKTEEEESIELNTCTPAPGSDLSISETVSCSNVNITVGNLTVNSSGFFNLTNVTLIVNNTVIQSGGRFSIRDSHRTIWQNGNLTIAGEYNLTNSTLRMNGTANFAVGINVTGNLLVNGSNISSGDVLDARYFFIINPASYFVIEGSHISRSGASGKGILYSGPYLGSNGSLSNTTLSYNYYGAIIKSAIGVHNLTAHNNLYGIYINSDNASIFDTYFIGNSDMHLFAVNSSGINISRLIHQSMADYRGFFFQNVNNSNMRGFTVHSVGADAIRFTSCNNNNLSDVMIHGAGEDGITLLTGSDNNYIRNITINNVSESGIVLSRSSGNRVEDISIRRSGDECISLSNGNMTRIQNLNLSLCGLGNPFDGYGISFSNFNFTNASGVTITDSNYGLALLSRSRNNQFVNSSITNSSEAGIYANYLTGGLLDNQVFNNLLNNTENIQLNLNTATITHLNTTLTSGTNIMGGSWIGGNFWAFPNGSGFSETCTDLVAPFGICDDYYNASNGTSVAIDWLPLSGGYTGVCDRFCYNCANCTAEIAAAVAGETVCLANDINASASCIGFNGKDNVTLDCQANVINGDDIGYGIFLNSSNGYSNFTIVRNCRITDFTDAIRLYGFNNSVADCQLSHSAIGMNLINAYGSNISNVTINNNTNGLMIDYSSDNLFIGLNLSENTQRDVYFFAPLDDNCDQRFIDVTGSGGRPVWFNSSAVNISDKDLSTLILCNASNSNLSNVTIRGSDLYNNLMQVLWTNYSMMRGINSSGNYIGLAISLSHRNNVTDSYFSGHASRGIELSGTFNYLSNITMQDNNVGIRLAYSAINNTINRSVIKNNTQGIYLLGVDPEYPLYNRIFDNLLNNTVNLGSNDPLNSNLWNTTLTSGTNIMGGSWIGGNYWTDPDGNFSDTCADLLAPYGICDEPYNITANNTDYYPLSSGYTGVCDRFCYNCSNCSAEILLASAGQTICLASNITGQDGNCIVFDTTDYITFDCQGNYIEGDYDGTGSAIYMQSSDDAEHNTLVNCDVKGFDHGYHIRTDFTLLANSSASQCEVGVYIYGSSNNLSNVNSSDNERGIYVDYSTNSIVRDSILRNNALPFFVYGTIDSQCDHQLINVSGNNSLPVLYFANMSSIGNMTLDQLVLCDADSSTVTNITILDGGLLGARLNNTSISDVTSMNALYGVYLYLHSDNNTLSGMNLSGNEYGIYMYRGVSNNTIINSTIRGSALYGISLDSYIYHIAGNRFNNNLFNNSVNLYSDHVNNSNLWNTTLTSGTNIMGGSWIGGNYWAFPNGSGFSDTCADLLAPYGICDEPYNITANNTDYYPLSSGYTGTCDRLCYDCSNCTAEIAAASAGERVCLANDIASNGTCINLTKTSVEFDCQDNAITGNGSSWGDGIRISGNYSSARNCIIKAFNTGVNIIEDELDNLTVDNISISGCYYGLHSSTYLSYRSRITNIMANNNTQGLDIYPPGWYTSYFLIENITSWNNSQYGLRIGSHYNSTIRNINVWENAQGLAVLDLSDYSNVSNVYSFNNTQYGLVSGARNVNYTNLTLKDNHIRDLQNTYRNFFTNLTGSGDRPIGAYTDSVNISDQEFAQLHVLGNNSVFRNITVIGSLLYPNNDVGILNSINVTLDYLRMNSTRNGLMITGSSSSAFLNLNLTKYVSVSTSQNLTFEGLRVSESTYGILLTDSSDCLITNSDLTGNNYSVKQYNMFAQNASHFIDCNLTGSNLSDIYIEGQSGSQNNTLVLTNSTFRSSNITLDDCNGYGCRMHVRWYADVQANYTNGTPVPGIVRGYNASGVQMDAKATDNGFARLNLTEVTIWSVSATAVRGNFNHHNNYTVNITDGILSDSELVNMSTNREINLTLGEESQCSRYCYNCSNCTAEIALASAGETLCLANDIYTPDEGVDVCIQFNGKDNLELDCLNNTIRNSNQIGQALLLNSSNGGSDNMTIRNCRTQGFYYAIEMHNSDNLSVHNSVINGTNTWGSGIRISYGSNILVNNSNISGGGRGVHHLYAQNVGIVDSVLENNLRAIDLTVNAGVCSLTIDNVTAGTGYPIKLITQNESFEHNSSVGQVIICNAENATVNNVTLAGQNDLLVTGGQNNIITNINISGAWEGLNIRGGYNYFENITIRNSSRFGITLDSSNNIFRKTNVSVGGIFAIRFGASNNWIEDGYIQSDSGSYDSLLYYYMAGDNNTVVNYTITGLASYCVYYGAGNSNRIINSTLSGCDYGFNFASATIENNTAYNNLINTSYPMISNGRIQYYNTTLTSGTNIMGGSWIGGNYWTDPDGNYSDTCADLLAPYGICDEPYNITANNTDYYPLSSGYTGTCDRFCYNCSNCTAEIALASAGETVCLAENITAYPSTCINFTRNATTFDCQGHTITGTRASASYGIYVNARTLGQVRDSQIKGCNVGAFGINIYLYGNSTNIISNFTVSDSASYNSYSNGIQTVSLYDGEIRNVISRNLSSSSDYSLFRIHGYNISISNISAYNASLNVDGLYVQGGNMSVTDIVMETVDKGITISAENSTFSNINITDEFSERLDWIGAISAAKSNAYQNITLNGRPARIYGDMINPCVNDSILDLSAAPYLDNTSKVVLLGCRNVTIQDGSMGAFDGIYLYSSDWTTVRNITIDGAAAAIDAAYSNFLGISELFVSGFDDDAYLSLSRCNHSEINNLHLNLSYFYVEYAGLSNFSDINITSCHDGPNIQDWAMHIYRPNASVFSNISIANCPYGMVYEGYYEGDRIEDLTISNTGWGIFMDRGDLSIINLTTRNVSDAIYLYDTDGNMLFVKNMITEMSNRSIRLEEDNYNITIVDSNLSSMYADFFVQYARKVNLTLLNVTFSNVSFRDCGQSGASCQINRGWYADIQANYTDGLPVQAGAVYGYNKTDYLVDSEHHRHRRNSEAEPDRGNYMERPELQPYRLLCLSFQLHSQPDRRHLF
jgi:parallel beta-helix repeat protein